MNRFSCNPVLQTKWKKPLQKEVIIPEVVVQNPQQEDFKLDVKQMIAQFSKEQIEIISSLVSEKMKEKVDEIAQNTVNDLDIQETKTQDSTDQTKPKSKVQKTKCCFIF